MKISQITACLSDLTVGGLATLLWKLAGCKSAGKVPAKLKDTLHHSDVKEGGDFGRDTKIFNGPVLTIIENCAAHHSGKKYVSAVLTAVFSDSMFVLEQVR